MPQNVWFTSDSHHSHDNILKYCKRPWPDTRSMNEALIANWNARVQKGDIVYYLGDFFLTRTVEEARIIRKRLNGSIRMIRGNHDQIAEQMRNEFEFVKDYSETSLESPSGKKHRIVMMHYPILSWRGLRSGAIHLHGHSHGATPVIPGVLRRDVGVDCNNFAPVSWEEIAAWAEAERVNLNKHDEYPGAFPKPPSGLVIPEGCGYVGMFGGVPLFAPLSSLSKPADE
jgi:calcineurin-like phosphoesterase family protein